MRPKDVLEQLEPWEEWTVLDGLRRHNEEMYGEPEKPRNNVLDLDALAAMGAKVE